jgi:hypothetical protein
MLQASKVHGNASYLVPCVVKAVQIMEALRTASAGLRVEDCLDATGYARSTIYRILRTLIACGYVRRDSRGAYHLNQRVISSAERDVSPASDPCPGGSNLMAHGGHLEFERWGVRFRCGGRPAPSPPSPGAGLLAGSQREA